MQCEEALLLWQRDLMGLPVEPARLAEALAHISACDQLCAQVLGLAPVPASSQPAPAPEGADHYEAQGLDAEQQGDRHAAEWARLVAQGQISSEAAERERELALASWQAAAVAYQEGWSRLHTAFLRAGLARIKKKRLPANAATVTAPAPAARPAASTPASIQKAKRKTPKRAPALPDLLTEKLAQPPRPYRRKTDPEAPR